MADDPIAPARGILLGFGLSVILWVILVLVLCGVL